MCVKFAKEMNTIHCADEDYIDMEIVSSPSKSGDFEFITFDQREAPPSKSRDFEFFIFGEKASSPSPADELFYKGKLLPLDLPHRQIVEHLLCTTAAAVDRYFSTAPCTILNTPSDSTNISPSESCRASCDTNPSDGFFEWPNEFTTFIKNHDARNTNPVNSWSRKLKSKRMILRQKLKSSRAYLRSLFSKTVCSDLSKGEDADANKYMKIGKKIADIIKSIDKNGIDENRRSFSGAIPNKCLSSSSSNSSSSCSSFNSSVVRGNFLRCSSANEIEGSIDAAIAHCKKSMLNNSKIDEPGISMRKFER